MSYYDELTPVHQACREGDTAALEHLRTRDPRKYAEILHSQPRTPLWWACKSGHAHVVRLLIEHGSPLECTGSGTSPLVEAAINGHVAVVKVLLEKGANLCGTKKASGEWAREGEREGPGVLAIAADRGELEMVKLLVEKGVDVNEGDSTPLLYASGKGHVEVLKYLVEKGATLHGGYVLACAVYNKQQKVVEWLLGSAGVKADAMSDGRTALTLAVRDNMEEMAKQLLRHGASPHVKLPKGEPMLYHTISRRFLGVARALLQYKAQVDEVYNGETALLLAVTRGNLEVVKMLWQFGANLNVRNVRTSPLCVAIRNCHWEVATFLIDRGSDVNLRENNKTEDISSPTPLHLLCMQRDHPIACSVAHSLLRNGADVNAVYMTNDVIHGKSGGPPIYNAINEGFTDMVWNLVFAGANLGKEIFVNGFPHSVWEMCEGDSETRKALFHFWEPSTHFRHPKRVRDAIVCVMMIAKRQEWKLDAPILQHLLSFVAYNWVDLKKSGEMGGALP